MPLIEAECTRCHETFIPAEITPWDLIHGMRVDGGDCGGIGVLKGQWLTRAEIAVQPHISRNIVKWVEAVEKHGWEHPMCNDPDCEFHHPEVIE